MKLEKSGRFEIKLSSYVGKKVELIDLFYVTDDSIKGKNKVLRTPFADLGVNEIDLTHNEIFELLKFEGYRMATRKEGSILIELLREKGEKKILVCDDEDEDKWFSFHPFGSGHDQFEDKEDEVLIEKFFIEDETRKPEESYALICIKEDD